jgi:TonB family protein
VVSFRTMRRLVIRRLVASVFVIVLWFCAPVFVPAQAQPTDNSGNAAPNGSSASITTSTENTASGGSSSEEVYRVGGAVSSPQLIYSPDPEYSEEARKAKLDGTCVLWLIVGKDGLPRDIKVARSLGHGLDEKAVEAVRQWRFEPARKDGKPVAAQINVLVTFRLFATNSSGIEIDTNNIVREAKKGDANAELQLAQIYLNIGNEKEGYPLLLKAANQGLPTAQFEMGEYTAQHGDRPGDNIVAYMWYALAQQNGNKHDKKKMKDLSSKMKHLSAKMSLENIAEAQTKAQNWKPSAN